MSPNERLCLTGVPVGSALRPADFDPTLDPLQREQLLAYGLAPGHALHVLQQQPPSVVLCDHVELALEHAVARLLWVEQG